MNGSILNYFELDENNIQRIERLRSEFQTYEEWIIGSCHSKFETPKNLPTKPKRARWNMDAFIHQSEKIGSVFYRDGDSEERIIMTQIWDGIDTSMNPIYTLMRNDLHNKEQDNLKNFR